MAGLLAGTGILILIRHGVSKDLLSLLGAAALNLVIGINHRSDRYYGV